MNKRIKQYLKTIARKILGLELKKLFIQVSVLKDVLSSGNNSLIDSINSCEGIIFSKDRAFQLHGLLASYYELVKNPVSLNILYTCSTTEHEQSYSDLQLIFRGFDVKFIKENAFRQDLLLLMKKMTCAKLFFLTDDAVFIDSFDMNDILKINPKAGVLQLHRGIDAKYNMHAEQNEKQPEFLQSDELACDQIYWEYDLAAFSVTYNYPLSLDATLFDRLEMLSLFQQIEFKAPNSLESMMQVYRPVMLNRKGICFKKAKYVNIPCNLVNSEVKNITTGFYTVENLLDRWNSGYRMNYEVFYQKDYDEVVKAKFDFVQR